MKWKWIVIGILVVTCSIGINVYSNLQPPQVLIGADTDAKEITILKYLKEHNYKLTYKRTYPILFRKIIGKNYDLLSLYHEGHIVTALSGIPGRSGGGTMSYSDITISVGPNIKGREQRMRIEHPDVGYGMFYIDKGNLVGLGYGAFVIDKQGNRKMVDQVGMQAPPVNRYPTR